MSDSNLLYVLEVQSDGLVYEVRLNDITVLREKDGASKSIQTKVNQFLIAGENTLLIRAGLPLITTPTKSPTRPLAFRMIFMRGEHGREPDETGIVSKLTWNAVERPLKPGNLETIFETSFDAGKGMGKWVWQDAPIEPIGVPARESIISLVKRFHSALSERDLVSLDRLLAVKNGEMARALLLSESEAAELATDQRDYFESYFASDEWQLEPFDPAQLVLTPQGGGRLIRITDLQENSPIKGSAGQRAFRYDLTVCKAAGEWTIVR